MKARKLFVISLAVICSLAVLLSLFFIFSIKDVKTTYTVTEGCSVKEIEETLNSYQKKNLLFLDVEDVKADLAKHPYFEIVSIEKDFPNVLNVVLKERREIFTLSIQNTVYILDKTGFVLNSLDKQTFDVAYADKQLIEVTLLGIKAKNVSVGSVIETDDQALFTAMLDMASAVQYTDTVNKVEISNLIEGQVSKDFNFTSFQTNTGVVIRIVKAQDRGVQKINNAMQKYYTGTDYDKARGVIESSYEDSGDPYVHWDKN